MKKTAKSEHTRLTKENEKLLKVIGAELKKRSVGDPNWGHVGDLGHAKERMMEILSFLRNAYSEDLMCEQIEKELQS